MGNRLSGVWYYSGNKTVSPRTLSKMKKEQELSQEINLFYIPDANEAANIFVHGFGNQKKKFGFWQSIKQGMKEYDVKQADANGNVKIFSCDVWLTNASWKISFLAVNGQSFLVIDGYLLAIKRGAKKKKKKKKKKKVLCVD